MKKDEKKMKKILQKINRLPLSPYRQRDNATRLSHANYPKIRQALCLSRSPNLQAQT